MRRGTRTTRRGTHTRAARRRRGTAILEFVMSLPILLFVLLGTWLFGWAMMNQQHVKISDRYAAWREVRGAGRAGPAQINQRFFRDTAHPLDIDRGVGTDQTILDLVALTGRIGGEAQMYADKLVVGRFPRSRSARVRARFPSDVDLWNRLEGRITSRHVREGREWRRKQADCERVLRDEFLADLDAELRGVDAPGRRLARVLRHLYDTKW
ncbi:MAG: TadE family protein [Planctomycetota bacterium]